MLHPSYSELMSVVNSGAEEGEQVVSSRYSIVKATAARAKQIIDARSINEKLDKITDNEIILTKEEKKKVKIGTELIDKVDDIKPLSVAVMELSEGKYTIVGSSQEEEI